ncbi:MAG: hypothetical protein JWO94_3102 [Verrucomicrobiaceae bacterium]|nr:hypothetical protein [Verrucomicrobiaceae bacterium]
MNAFSELEQLFETSRPCFTVETASNLVSLGTDPEKAVRMESLSDKANEGRLSLDEEQEYWSYLYAARMMSILKLQAKLFLKRMAA